MNTPDKNNDFNREVSLLIACANQTDHGKCDNCEHAIKRRVKSKRVETFIGCNVFHIPMESCTECKYFEEVTPCSEENKE